MSKVQITESSNKTSQSNVQTSKLIQKYIRSVSIRNEKTAIQYLSRLLIFETFIIKEYRINTDILIQKLKSNKEYDLYDVLNDYCVFLQNNYDIGSVTFRDKIITVKNFLEYNDLDINQKKKNSN